MKYSGMTMNERLHASGLLDKFELAVKQKDKDRITEILRLVEVDESIIKEYIRHRDRNLIQKAFVYIIQLFSNK